MRLINWSIYRWSSFAVGFIFGAVLAPPCFAAVLGTIWWVEPQCGTKGIHSS